MRDLRFILKYLGKYKKDLILAIMFIVVETVFEIFIPFLMKDIIDTGIHEGNMKQILISGALIIICAFFSLTTGHFYAKYNARLVTNYSYTLRQEAFQKIQTYSFANLDHFQTASLVTRITNDVMVMQNTLVGGIRPLCRSPLLLIMGIGLSFVMAPELAWIFIVCVPILGIILFLIIWKTAPKYSVLQKSVDDLNQVVRENVSAIRTVKSYVREDYEIEKFAQANTKVMKTTKTTFKIAQLNLPSFQLVMYGVTVLILGLGAIMVHNEDLKVGSLSAILSYVSQIVNSLMLLSNVFLLINRSFASSKRLKEILTEEPTICSKEDALKEISQGDIEFKNVSFKYHEQSQEYILSNINLKIKQGESIGILGGTGSAKSTLVSLILRLYDVTEGQIILGGNDVKDYDLKVLRDSVSIVLQNNVLFSGTIRENLLWGNPNASDEELEEVCKLACVDEFLSRLPNGLDYDLGQGGVNVSGGQKQRLCIARALLKNPKVIIFDDSTSACDMETERKIMESIRSLKNVTNIVIAQRITSVMNADKIIILDNGQIVDIGTHQHLLESSAIYKELYSQQLGGVLECHQ
ncbi:MAG: ABC transporter ATP-binding protein/permease [Roseburia sp.]|nr:ABC transporter ATP-binding protein/permease [Anaeroplasma bactoclasticum]MCM1196518.1 ABC transporter ATP-binding protein/permease [Roseburia sp.]MCM1557252.1 ABC transporter ATP-binding protein/permease [Anaeroplasma bactoclasticum]